MSVYDERPWLHLYDEGLPADLAVEHRSALAMFQAAAGTHPERPLIHYFDATLTVAEVDRASDALACALQSRGLSAGDRVAVCLQNVPQFVLAVLAVWKAGAIVVPVNPMWKGRELQLLLTDSGARVLVTLESLYAEVAADVLGDTAVEVVVTTSELEYVVQRPRLLEHVTRARRPGTADLLELVAEFDGRRPPPVELDAGDIAFLTYTSGTTGPPKGATNTHGNVVFTAQVYQDWIGLDSSDVVLGVAPLFHITGLIAHLAVGLLVPMPIVLGYRFDAETTLDLIERWKATFTVASITVFIALMNVPSAERRHLTGFTKVYSGGAPIAPGVVQAYEAQFGASIHSAYGLTETTSPSHLGPLRRRAPVDQTSGALSIGVPVFSTRVRIVDEDGRDLPPGEVGELVTSGPQVVPGYWNKPDETAHALPGGALHTGDVGFMDPDGWFYLVDRKKDQINAAGYKVWPREVEDVLYEHPAVREAAVVGVPDPYRGETVKAYVSLKAGQAAGEQELITHCRQRLAAYKYPRSIEILDELPKTVTGKILRRELRTRPAYGSP